MSNVAGKYRGFICTLTMLTITHADRSRPTLKDDERFRKGLVRCDLNEFTKNAKLFMNAKSIYMNAKSIYMNAKRIKLNLNINLKTMLYENSCYKQKYNLAAIFKNSIGNLILRTFSCQIINPTSSLIHLKKDNLSVYNIRKLYCATLLSCVFF